MPNLSQLKRECMLAFLQEIMHERMDDEDMFIVLEVRCLQLITVTLSYG